ncbi:MAG TPA: hypothetical protein VJ782_07885, partial [Aeromicrobium sp.]|nr:hypothetical protein [Aeromicrobium sp.]
VSIALAVALAPSAGFGHGELPGTKNAISRAPAAPGTADPTTRADAAAAIDAAAAQRAEPDPTLVTASGAGYRPHATIPEDRYAMARGCYVLRAASNGKWVARAGTGYSASASTSGTAERFHFQATDLGTYLLWDTQQKFVTSTSGAASAATKPAPAAEWTAQSDGGKGRFTFTSLTDKPLGLDSQGTIGSSSAESFQLAKASGCPSWPEVEVGVSGGPHGGTTSYQEVRGYVDAHTHGMAFEFLGGSVHCGRPWHRYGVASALVDCPDHAVAGGNGAVLENFLRHGTPTGSHDPVGWPTFKDWPAPESLTHEGTYWKWLERSWRGGQRILVNLLVQNNKLCELYPLKRNSCNDMDAVRLQASDMRQMERYIDAQFGGPGRGFYRIVTDPFEARKVINGGRMAVVMGIETSVIFGCTKKLDIPGCTKNQIDDRLDEVYDLGVRQMELVNKFDNALSGVAGDSGAIAPLVNGANFLETGTFWDMRACEGAEGVHDQTQFTAVPGEVPAQDELFGAITRLYGLGVPALPLYPSGPTCNSRGLTELGDHTIRRLVEKHMIFDPDHMSVKARQESMDLVEGLKYPGVVSSHSWSTPDAYPRVYKAGGFITPYAGDSSGFVSKWQRHLTWVDPRFYWAIGFGADINGFGAQGDPRGADVSNPVTYPFTGLGGVTIDQQVSGQRTYDINTDGVAHYGLYPDWIEDLRRLGGETIADDMARGAEGYLQMWERGTGIANDGCRQASVRKSTSTVLGIPKGTSVTDVLKRAGIPHERLGAYFGYCTTSASGSAQRVRVTFDSSGKVTGAKTY